MADIKGGFTDREFDENHGKQKKGKGKKYQKKYERAKRDCEKQRNKNKRLRQKMKYKEKLHTEREARCKEEGKAEAYKEIIEKITRSKCTLNLPESVIEVDGEVCDD